MKEALVGLPGIAALEVDLKKDLFRISFDPKRVTTARIQETVRKQGFQCEIVKDAVVSPRITGKVHHDLARLPKYLQEQVQSAKADRKAMLLAFHGLG